MKNPFLPYALVVATVAVASVGVYHIGRWSARSSEDLSPKSGPLKLYDRATVPRDTFVLPVIPPPPTPCDAKDDDCGSVLVGAAPNYGEECRILHGDEVFVAEISETMVVLMYAPVAAAAAPHRCPEDTLFLEYKSIFEDYDAAYRKEKTRRAEEAALIKKIKEDGVAPRPDAR